MFSRIFLSSNRDAIDRERNRRSVVRRQAHRAAAARAPWAGFAVGLMLTACASAPGPKIELDRAAIARYRETGYAHRMDEDVTHRRIVAPDSLAPWHVTIVALPGAATRPVIVYLPALGDADDAPCRWLDLWARAGYVVLAVQPLDEDAQVWTTDAARSGEFERLARSRFAAELMPERLAHLARVLGQLRGRGPSLALEGAGLDWTRLAVAGADLGAYAVQSIAALPAERLLAMGWPAAPRAFLAISPYGRAAPETDANIAHASAPLLMVSSRDDVDAYGVVNDVALRHQAFDRLVGNDDDYLEFAVATHRWLSGAAAPLAVPGETPVQRMAPQRQPGPMNRGAGDDRLAPTDDDDLSPEARKRLAASRAEKEAQMARQIGRQLTQLEMTQIGFEDVTLAFLDKHLRQDAQARSWLDTAAAEWLKNGDRIKHR